MISVSDSYELFVETVGKCTSDVLARNDEHIQCELFEEFEVGAHSFLHEDPMTS
jgi:hypothetical protein